jgi:hypothetical protein
MPDRGDDHPSQSSTKVKERVELYLYSPSGPSMIRYKAKFTIYLKYFAMRYYTKSAFKKN